MSVKININQHAVEARVMDAFKKGLPLLTAEIRDDCNLYCKEESGTLKASSMVQSKLELGQIIWQTAYARRQYWEIRTAYQDVNKLATWRWAEVAKRTKLNKWQMQAQRLLEMNL